MTSPKRILVLFADEWAAYSPTLQNLVTVLGRDGRFEVSALCVDSGAFRYESLPEPPYERLAVPSRDAVERAAEKRWSMDRAIRDWINARVWPHQALDAYTVAKGRRLVKALIGRDPDHVVAIDPLAMLLAGVLFRDVSFLSLEVRQTMLLDWLSPSRFAAVVIQNEERRRLLFPRGLRTEEGEPPVFHVQNSHIFAGRVPRHFSRSLVYFGNIADTHGLRLYPDLLDHLPGWTLTMKGIVSPGVREAIAARWGRHLASGRLRIDEEHIPQDRVVEWLRGFGVGLCVYDIELLERTVTRSTRHLVEHFRNCPSGKLFNYYAAGVPVVANDLPGLRSVADHGAGILAPADAASMAEAAGRIEADYGRFVDGAYAAAEAWDFARLAAPFLDWLATRPSVPPRTRREAASEQSLRLGGFVRALSSGLRSPAGARMARIRDLVGTRPVIVYGAGEHTEWLLRDHALGSLLIAAYADGDPAKQGTTFHGRPVIAPEAIPDHAADVFISSYAHEAAIVRALGERHPGRLSLHRLYGDEGSA